LKLKGNSIYLNISKGFVWQGVGIISTLVSLPISIRFLGKHDYGIWITIYGTVLWMSGFDFGIGNGFRNELAISFTQGERRKSSYIVSNAFLTISMIAGLLMLLGFIINYLLHAGLFFNVAYAEGVYSLVNVLLVFFGMEMIFKLTGTIYTADQRASIVPFVTGINNVLVLLCVFLLERNGSFFKYNRLFVYGLFVGIIPFLSNSVLTVFSFSSRYRYLLPTFKNYDLTWIKKIFATGIKFFGIQIAMIFLLQLSNILVTSWSSPVYVTTINIADKYFGIISIVGTIILFPFWSAFTAANERKEHVWIKKTLVKLEYVFVGLAVVGILLFFLFPFVVKIWFKHSLVVPASFMLVILLKNLFIILNSIYSYYLNSIGKVNLQLILYTTFAVLNVPVSYLLFTLFGTVGILVFVPLAMLMLALSQKQYINKILAGKINNTDE
jgi:O-antigen/teichoic acid export membrane protein